MPRCEQVEQIHIAFVRVYILAKHQIHTLIKLDAAGIVDVTCVNLKIEKTVVDGLFSAEFNLFVTSFILASAFHEVFDRDFLCSPGMRQYSILRNGTFMLLHQTQSTLKIHVYTFI